MLSSPTESRSRRSRFEGGPRLALVATIGWARFPSRQSSIEGEDRRAIGTENLTALAHFQEDMGMVVRWRCPDALKLANTNHDARHAQVVEESDQRRRARHTSPELRCGVRLGGMTQNHGTAFVLPRGDVVTIAGIEGQPPAHAREGRERRKSLVRFVRVRRAAHRRLPSFAPPAKGGRCERFRRQGAILFTAAPS